MIYVPSNRLFKIRIKPICVDEIQAHGSVRAILKDAITGQKKLIKGHNIVTDVGDIYAAKKFADEVPDYNFATSCILKVGTGTSLTSKSDTDIEQEITGSCKMSSDGYPKTGDDDPDNGDGGVDIVTWKFYYDMGELIHNGISECGIASECGIPPNQLLSHVLFDSAFDKDGSHTLTIFINHRFNGV